MRGLSSSHITSRPQGARTKGGSPYHNVAMLGVRRSRQTLRQLICDHLVRAQRNELNNLLRHQILEIPKGCSHSEKVARVGIRSRPLFL